jgi:hypothetical protein
VRRVLLATVAALSAAVVTVPAHAAQPVHYAFTTDPTVVIHQPCGIVETVFADIHGTEHFNRDGSSRRILEHVRYHSTFTSATGTVLLTASARQNAELTPQGVNSLRGQGLFLVVPGIGPIWHDVGTLVFSDLTGATLHKSAKTYAFDQSSPDVSAILCAAFA